MASHFDPKAVVTLPGRSRIDLSYRNTFTAKMGQLIPALCKPVVPGDRFRIGLAYQMQLAPMLNPVYDGLTVNFEAFYVPNRILDPQWREFWTGYNDYDQTTPVEVAPLTWSISVNAPGHAYGDGEIYDDAKGTGIGVSSLLDYLGVQVPSYQGGVPVSNLTDYEGSITVNAYPILAYNRIFDDWYRNERTQQASLYGYYNNFVKTGRRALSSIVSGDVEGGTEVYTSVPIAIHQRNYAKDRFTTALPEPIVGGDVHIPVGNSFTNLINTGSDNGLINGAVATSVNTVSGGNTYVPQVYGASSGVSLNALALGTIQQLKFAFKEYEYRMKDTYNGNRYVESFEAHYGVRVPDSTLQRSLYLGSAQDYVNFGEVYQTSSGDGTGDTGALGDYAGRGNANGFHRIFDETFYEPGFVFVIFSVSPKSRYFQGVQRFMVRYERDDYFSPEYQNIGDDFIQNREIYNDFMNTEADPEGVFGYQTRWYDLKSNYDELHGDFAHIYLDDNGDKQPGQMMTWTFSRYFTQQPVISEEFSKIPIINRPFVDESFYNDNYFVDIAFKIDALRPILTVESF